MTTTRATLAGTTLSATLAIALCAPAFAQSGPLIGFGADLNGSNSAILDQALCNPAMVVCTNVLPGPAQPHAGGAAFDPHRESLWHTEGTRLFEVTPDGCVRGCATPAALVLGPNSLVGGLTFDTRPNQLIHVESVPGVAAIVTYQLTPSQRCPTRLGACRVMLPTQRHLAGAIALDAKRDHLYVATSLFAAGAAPQNGILLIDRNDPQCAPRCLLTAQNCGRGTLQAIRAMAYDECDDRLYVSDGRQTSVFRVQHAGTRCPRLLAETCCPTNAPNGQFWAGFDRRPIEPRRLGGGCLPRRSCPTCPTPPTLSTSGAAVIGNTSFRFHIGDAPAGTTGFVIFTPGSCVPQNFSCGTLYPALPTMVLGPMPLAGGACSAGADFPLPIPENFALCNLLLCAQGLLICPNGGLGLTNAQVIPINP